VDEGTYRRARIRAAELDTSVSALVRNYLRSLAAGNGSVTPSTGLDIGAEAETPLQRRRRQLREVFADFDRRGVGLDPRHNLPREELYDRARARAEIAESAAERPAPTDE
jgi:plasmid stability protein